MNPREPDNADDVEDPQQADSFPADEHSHPARLNPDDFSAQWPGYPGAEVSAIRVGERPHITPRLPAIVPQARIEPRSVASEFSRRVHEPTKSFFMRRLTFMDQFYALILSTAAVIAVLFTYHGIGHSWDEALYLKPAAAAFDWYAEAARGNWDMLKPETIGKYWGGQIGGPDDPLHPEIAPLPKLVIGAGLRTWTSLGHEPMIAMRLPIALFFGLSIFLIYLLGAREYGRIGGFAAAAAYLFMPRVFGHAHIAASETLLAFTVLFTVWAFLRGTELAAVGVLTGLAFGLAAATKFTALLLPIPLIFWAQFYRRRDYGLNVFAMMFIAPLVLVALWPWLWHDGLRKFFQYIGFYLFHQSTSVYYLDERWGFGRSAAPWHYPFVITGVSVPEWILLFAFIGVIRTVVHLRRRAVSLLFFMLAVFPLVISALPKAPKYDGERLFFSAFAFIALLAGGGFSGVFSWTARAFDNPGFRANRGWFAGTLLLALSLLGVFDLWRSHPNQLNYFNWIVGGPAGAHARGFETSYWGEAVNEEVIQELNEVTKPGDRVRTMALNELVFRNLQDWGKLPREVDFSPPDPPDWYLLQVRMGMMGRREQYWHMQKPVKVFSVQKVPRIELFKGERGTTQTGNAEAPADVVEHPDSPPPVQLPAEVPRTTATPTTPPVVPEVPPAVPEVQPSPTPAPAATPIAPALPEVRPDVLTTLSVRFGNRAGTR